MTLPVMRIVSLPKSEGSVLPALWSMTRAKHAPACKVCAAHAKSILQEVSVSTLSVVILPMNYQHLDAGCPLCQRLPAFHSMLKAMHAQACTGCVFHAGHIALHACMSVTLSVTGISSYPLLAGRVCCLLRAALSPDSANSKTYDSADSKTYASMQSLHCRCSIHHLGCFTCHSFSGCWDCQPSVGD